MSQKRQQPIACAAPLLRCLCVWISLGSMSKNRLNKEAAKHLAVGLQSNQSLTSIECAPLFLANPLMRCNQTSAALTMFAFR